MRTLFQEILPHQTRSTFQGLLVIKNGLTHAEMLLLQMLIFNGPGMVNTPLSELMVIQISSSNNHSATTFAKKNKKSVWHIHVYVDGIAVYKEMLNRGTLRSSKHHRNYVLE